MNKRLTLVLLSAILLTACGPLSKEERAGKAMAETACLLFQENDVSMDSAYAESTTILSKYGFEKASDIDEYLSSIQGTEELNTVTATARDALTATCGDELTSKGVDPSDLAKAMVSQ